MTATKQIPVVLIETLNGTPERNNSNGFGSMELSITRALRRMLTDMVRHHATNLAK